MKGSGRFRSHFPLRLALGLYSDLEWAIAHSHVQVVTGTRQLSPYMLMMPLMMIMMSMGLMAGHGGGGKKVPEIN
ncbi:MAG TPA: hypothetical protein VF498_12605, partial [Anaerolineales bacterium]